MKTIAIYGGAFDPPHLGHIEVVRRTLELPDVSEVMIVPSRNPPHKAPVASYCRRMNMTKRVMRDAFLKGTLSQKPLVSNIETRVQGTTYTVDVLRHLSWKPEEVRYRLVLGTDEVRSIMKWRQPNVIFGRIGMIVAGRPGTPEIDYRHGFSNVVVKAIAEALRFNVADEFLVSSSGIRSSIAIKSGWWKQFVPESIAEYIRKNGLYGYEKEQ